MSRPVRTARTARSHRVLRATLLALVALVAATLAGCGESADDAATTTTDTPTKTTAAATEDTEIAPDTSTTAPQNDGGIDTADEVIWPYANGSTSYDDPVEVARAFASEYLGFTKLVVGDFTETGEGSGTVEIRAFDGGTPTVVDVVRIGDAEGWGVTGATNEHLVVDTPARNATITSPVTVSGRSTAFEGTIDIMIREYGRMDPLVQDFANGGANGEMGPFATQVDPAEGGADQGALIVSTQSMEDGGTMEATVVRVRFG